MNERKKIQSALISVFDKSGLGPIIEQLHKDNVALYSTGGTQAFIEEMNIPVNRVEDLTSYPSILGGRVKTLHPKVFGGILNRRNHDGDQSQIAEFEIPELDLVIVDLYPFEDYFIKCPFCYVLIIACSIVFIPPIIKEKFFLLLNRLPTLTWIIWIMISLQIIIQFKDDIVQPFIYFQF